MPDGVLGDENAVVRLGVLAPDDRQRDPPVPDRGQEFLGESGPDGAEADEHDPLCARAIRAPPRRRRATVTAAVLKSGIPDIGSVASWVSRLAESASGVVERHEHRVVPDVGAEPGTAAHACRGRSSSSSIAAVDDAEPRGRRGVELGEHLRLGRVQFLDPPGLGARLVVLEQAAGDQGELPVLSTVVLGFRVRRDGDDARQAVRVRERFAEQSGGAGRIRPGTARRPGPRCRAGRS